MLLAYLCFYARYTVWSGDFAWGSLRIEGGGAAVFLAVPLLMRHRTELGRVVWAVGIALLAMSAAIQLASWLSGYRLRSTRWTRWGIRRLS